jgi:hypothetical protein
MEDLILILKCLPATLKFYFINQNFILDYFKIILKLGEYFSPDFSVILIENHVRF